MEPKEAEHYLVKTDNLLPLAKRGDVIIVIDGVVVEILSLVDSLDFSV
jgi:hypothetical protein